MKIESSWVAAGGGGGRTSDYSPPKHMAGFSPRLGGRVTGRFTWFPAGLSVYEVCTDRNKWREGVHKENTQNRNDKYIKCQEC